MGNAVDKGRGQGYYGGTGEDISYEEAEDFLIVTLSPATIANSLPENNRTPKSPFEATTTAAATTAAERTVHLEGSIDSGYAEVHAANKCVSGTIPEQIPTKPTENVSLPNNMTCVCLSVSLLLIDVTIMISWPYLFCRLM